MLYMARRLTLYLLFTAMYKIGQPVLDRRSAPEEMGLQTGWSQGAFPCIPMHTSCRESPILAAYPMAIRIHIRFSYVQPLALPWVHKSSR